MSVNLQINYYFDCPTFPYSDSLQKMPHFGRLWTEEFNLKSWSTHLKGQLCYVSIGQALWYDSQADCEAGDEVTDQFGQVVLGCPDTDRKPFHPLLFGTVVFGTSFHILLERSEGCLGVRTLHDGSLPDGVTLKDGWSNNRTFANQLGLIYDEKAKTKNEQPTSTIRRTFFFFVVGVQSEWPNFSYWYGMFAE